MEDIKSTEGHFYKEAAKGLVLNYVVANVVLVLQFFITIILIRYLSVENFGVYSILAGSAAILGILPIIPCLMISRFVPSYMEKDNYFLAKKMVAYGLLFNFIYGALAVVCFSIFPSLFNALFQGNSFESIYVIIFSFFLLFNFQGAILEATLIALLEQRIRNAARLLYTIIFLAFSFLVLSASPNNLQGVLLAMLTAIVVLVVIDLFAVYKMLLRRESKGERSFEVGRISRYVAFSQLGYIGDLFLNLSVDIILVGIFLGTTAAGWYAFGIKVPQTIIGYSPAVLGSGIIFPFIVRKYTQTKNKNILSYFFQLYNRFTAFFAFPLLLGLVMLAEPIINYIFNPAYIGASANIFIVAAIAFTVVAFRWSVCNIYNILEKPEIGFYSKIIFILSTIANIILLMSGKGILVVVTVTGIAMALMYSMEFLLTRRHIELSLPLREFALIAVNALVMAAVVFLLKGFASSLLMLLAVVAVGMAVYFSISFFNKPFTEKDSELFSKVGSMGKLLTYFARGK